MWGEAGGLDTTGTRGGLRAGVLGASPALGPTSSPGLPASNKHAAVRPQERSWLCGAETLGPWGARSWDQV